MTTRDPRPTGYGTPRRSSNVAEQPVLEAMATAC